MNELVIMKGQQAVTTSLQVAEVFGKNHKHVLDASVDYLLGKTDIETPKKETRDLEVEEALNSMRSYQGQPITDEEREVMRGIIKAYLDNKKK